MSMSKNNVVFMWEKTGIIPYPSMPGDRVHSGLLLSLIAKVCLHYKKVNKAFYEEVETLIEKVIKDPVMVEFSKDEKHVFVDIMSSSGPDIFGYTLYVPLSWMGAVPKK